MSGGRTTMKSSPLPSDEVTTTSSSASACVSVRPSKTGAIVNTINAYLESIVEVVREYVPSLSSLEGLRSLGATVTDTLLQTALIQGWLPILNRLRDACISLQTMSIATLKESLTVESLSKLLFIAREKLTVCLGQIKSQLMGSPIIQATTHFALSTYKSASKAYYTLGEAFSSHLSHTLATILVPLVVRVDSILHYCEESIDNLLPPIQDGESAVRLGENRSTAGRIFNLISLGISRGKIHAQIQALPFRIRYEMLMEAAQNGELYQTIKMSSLDICNAAVAKAVDYSSEASIRIFELTHTGQTAITSSVSRVQKLIADKVSAVYSTAKQTIPDPEIITHLALSLKQSFIEAARLAVPSCVAEIMTADLRAGGSQPHNAISKLLARAAASISSTSSKMLPATIDDSARTIANAVLSSLESSAVMDSSSRSTASPSSPDRTTATASVNGSGSAAADKTGAAADSSSSGWAEEHAKGIETTTGGAAMTTDSPDPPMVGGGNTAAAATAVSAIRLKGGGASGVRAEEQPAATIDALSTSSTVTSTGVSTPETAEDRVVMSSSAAEVAVF